MWFAHLTRYCNTPGSVVKTHWLFLSENVGYLAGRAAPPDVVRDIVAIASSLPRVLNVYQVIAGHAAPDPPFLSPVARREAVPNVVRRYESRGAVLRSDVKDGRSHYEMVEETPWAKRDRCAGSSPLGLEA